MILFNCRGNLRCGLLKTANKVLLVEHGTRHLERVPWAQALSDSRSVQLLSDLVHQPVGVLCPNRTISAFDLVDASSARVMMVVPNVTLPVAPSGPWPRQQLAVPLMQSGHIYVINGLRATPAQLTTVLGNVRAQLSDQHLASVSYSWLQ